MEFYEFCVMEEKVIPNYYEKLKPYFKIYGKMLDVGCGENFTYLFQFDESKFDKLIGLDIIIPDNRLYPYLKSKIEELTPEKCNEYIERLSTRYEFIKRRLQDYDIKDDDYGLIFCRHMLHFIEFEKQGDLIKKLLKGLRKDGLLFLKINHLENVMYQDRIKLEEIRKGIYKVHEKWEKGGQIHYVRKPEEMEKIIIECCEPVELKRDETTVTAIIRK